MKQLPRTILVDLDHTIAVPVVSDDPAVKYGRAIPILSTIEQLRRARAHGFEIVIYTARGMLTKNGDVAAAQAYAEADTVAWLALHDVPYDRIQWGKPSSCVIIDDLAIHPGQIESWMDTQVD